MKINIIMIEKTDVSFVIEGVDEYLQRLKHYIKVDTKVISIPKNFSKLSINEQKSKESELIEKNIDLKSKIFLLDENGQEFTSKEFATWLKKQSNSSEDLTFVIGGAFGFSEKLLNKYSKIALSKMTFTHQMVRLFFVEQLYRAYTILKGENYHH